MNQNNLVIAGFVCIGGGLAMFGILVEIMKFMALWKWVFS